jgi:hypothetical protein
MSDLYPIRVVELVPKFENYNFDPKTAYQISFLYIHFFSSYRIYTHTQG